MKLSLLFLAVLLIAEVGGAQIPQRRSYPGGKDDSDLTVQPLRKITRKGEETEVEYGGGYGESGESDGPPSQEAEPAANSTATKP